MENPEIKLLKRMKIVVIIIGIILIGSIVLVVRTEVSEVFVKGVIIWIILGVGVLIGILISALLTLLEN